MTESTLPDYEQCTAILKQANLAVSAAEFHGLLTGVLCAGMNEKSNWLVLLYDHTNQGTPWSNSAKNMAERFFEQTLAALNSELMDFTVFLANDDSSLLEQADSLVDWVNGFLAGFGIANTSKALNIENKEILEDLAQIAQLGIDEEENEDEQLSLLFDVREHVRICILTLHADNLLKNNNKSSRALH